jgi:hypothetical protein
MALNCVIDQENENFMLPKKDTLNHCQHAQSLYIFCMHKKNKK